MSTQYIGKSDTVRVPTPPTFSGYSFNSWLVNGVTRVSDPAAYELKGDTVFTANYTARSVSVSNTYRFGSNGMVCQYNILNYLSNNGHGYVQNMQMLKNFNIVVRIYAGRMNGATYYLNQSSYVINRIACNIIHETFAKGTLYFSVGILANGYIQMQLTFEGTGLLNTNMYDGCSVEIVSMNFQPVDF